MNGRSAKIVKLIGQTVQVQLNTVERCSGHAGTYGVKTAYHANAMKIGKPVFKAMATMRIMPTIANMPTIDRKSVV